ncbi:hypothetical protein ERJ75_000007200 [Trypanosoma vivax]|nr:hypothetical protein ERJ75_000007200 [Trypanosoma vivax]
MSAELRVGNRFRVGQKIGSGSFGEIFRGTNVQNGDPVAIKLEQAKTRHHSLPSRPASTASSTPVGPLWESRTSSTTVWRASSM